MSRKPDDRVTFFRNDGRRVLICINRGDYWQLAYVIPHGAFEGVRRAGLTAFRADVAAAVPALADRLPDIAAWHDVKLLSVRVDRLRRWYRPGLLCLGDAAHAMSPAGGVGINLAIQDAVAAANILGSALRSGRPTVRHLRRVQRRRELPARLTQAFQLRALRGLYPRPGSVGGDAAAVEESARLPLVLRLVRRVPPLRQVTGRFIGMGVRPEHLHPDRPSTSWWPARTRRARARSAGPSRH